MCPTFTFKQTVDACPCDIVAFCNIRSYFTFFKCLANVTNVILCQFVYTALFATLGIGMNVAGMPAFHNHIVRVVFSSSEKQMTRVAAQPVITSVQDKEHSRIKSMFYPIGYSTSSKIMAFTDNKDSVSRSVLLSFPWPTPLSKAHINLGPKTSDLILTQINHSWFLCRHFYINSIRQNVTAQSLCSYLSVECTNSTEFKSYGE